MAFLEGKPQPGMSQLQGLFRILHPLIRMATHLSCCFWLLLWAECWCPSLCLDNFPEQLKLIISGIFNRVWVSYLAFHFLSVEFIFSSYLLIRKIYGFILNFWKILSQECLSRLHQLFHLLISPLNSRWVVNMSDFSSRVDSGAASLLALFQNWGWVFIYKANGHKCSFFSLTPVPSCGPSSLILRLLPVSCSSFLSNPACVFHMNSQCSLISGWEMWPLKIKKKNYENNIKIIGNVYSILDLTTYLVLLSPSNVFTGHWFCSLTNLLRSSTTYLLIIFVLSSDRSPLLLFFTVLSPGAFPSAASGIQKANEIHQVGGRLQSPLKAGFSMF